MRFNLSGDYDYHRTPIPKRKPFVTFCFLKCGSMLEWLMGTDCKSAGDAYAGSNPARPKYETDTLLCILLIFFRDVITE